MPVRDPWRRGEEGQRLLLAGRVFMHSVMVVCSTLHNCMVNGKIGEL